MLRKKIGIVGFGFVGRAIAHGFGLHADIKMYDKYDDTYFSIEETVRDSEFVFLCVPTPMDELGRQDPSNILDAVFDIDKVSNEQKIIIIKSTVVPGTGRSLANQFPNHSFVSNPEFLTERSYKLDFINASRIILGSDSMSVLDKVEEMYRTRFTHTPIYKTTWEGAEVAKYMANCFFALKVSYMNEMFEVAEKIGVPYNQLRDMFLADYRIGNSHVDVPGHDGLKGFGGKCFPKDMKAFVKWGEENNFSFLTLRAAEMINKRVREEKDWEKIKGATTKNDYREKEYERSEQEKSEN